MKKQRLSSDIYKQVAGNIYRFEGFNDIVRLGISKIGTLEVHIPGMNENGKRVIEALTFPKFISNLKWFINFLIS